MLKLKVGVILILVLVSVISSDVLVGLGGKLEQFEDYFLTSSSDYKSELKNTSTKPITELNTSIFTDYKSISLNIMYSKSNSYGVLSDNDYYHYKLTDEATAKTYLAKKRVEVDFFLLLKKSKYLKHSFVSHYSLKNKDLSLFSGVLNGKSLENLQSTLKYDTKRYGFGYKLGFKNNFNFKMMYLLENQKVSGYWNLRNLDFSLNSLNDGIQLEFSSFFMAGKYTSLVFTIGYESYRLLEQPITNTLHVQDFTNHTCYIRLILYKRLF